MWSRRGVVGDGMCPLPHPAMSPRVHADPTPLGYSHPQDGSTALIEAASNGKKDVIVLLLEHGADIEAKDKVWGMMRVCVWPTG